MHSLALLSLFCLLPLISARSRVPAKGGAVFEPEAQDSKSLWELVTEDEDGSNPADTDYGAQPATQTAQVDSNGNVELSDAPGGDEGLIRTHKEEAEVQEEAEDDPSIVFAQIEDTETGISKTAVAAFAVFLSVAVVTVAMGIYFKRAAEALKARTLAASDSEAEETETDSSFYDEHNPRVAVNRQLLERMTSISNKLKASVQQARSETSSSLSAGSGDRGNLITGATGSH